MHTPFSRRDLLRRVPGGVGAFQSDFDFTKSKGFILRVSAGIDINSNTLSWVLDAIDPLTGEVVTDQLGDVRVRRDASDDRLVGAGHSVAEDRSAEPVELELDGQRPRCYGRHALPAEASTLVLPVALVLGHALGYQAVDVPTYEPDVGEALESVEDFGRVRPADEVTSADDRVDRLRLDLSEDGLESRQVAVDVVERRDSHGQTLATRRTRDAGPRTRGRAQGTRSTRTRSGSDESRLPESARSPPRAAPRAPASPPS